MKKSFLFHLHSSVILLLICIFSGCSGDSGGVEPGIDLAGKWKITDNDSPENASLSFNDGQLAEYNIPGNWLSILKKKTNCRHNNPPLQSINKY